MLYALGIGSCGKDAMDEKELQHVYHEDGQHHVKVTTFSFLCTTKMRNNFSTDR